MSCGAAILLDSLGIFLRSNDYHYNNHYDSTTDDYYCSTAWDFLPIRAITLEFRKSRRLHSVPLFRPNHPSRMRWLHTNHATPYPISNAATNAALNYTLYDIHNNNHDHYYSLYDIHHDNLNYCCACFCVKEHHIIVVCRLF